MSAKRFLVLIIISFSSFYIIIGISNNKENNKKINEFFNNQTGINEYKMLDVDSYLAVLEIPKINLKKGLFSIDNPQNNVEKNIEINAKSDMPNGENGNFILEAHSGLSFVSYFNKLENLTKGDEVLVYYDGVKYVYNINKFYDISKTGKAKIKRDYTQNTITLITCKKRDDTKQVVYIGYLVKKEAF